MFALCNPNIAGLLQGEQTEIWAQSGPRPRWFERRRQSIAISPKLLELETSNLVHSFIWGMPIGHRNNFPKSGRGLGHVTATIFGIRSSISSKLLELETSNLVHGFLLGMPGFRSLSELSTLKLVKSWCYPVILGQLSVYSLSVYRAHFLIFFTCSLLAWICYVNVFLESKWLHFNVHDWWLH